MEWVLLGIFAFITALIVPWVAIGRTTALERRITALEARLQGTQPQSAMQSPSAPVSAPIAPPAAIARPVAATATPPQPPSANDFARGPAAWTMFEERFVRRWPVWLGGVALAMAGFYLVKWTIDAGLLTPPARVVLGLLFGGALLKAGAWIRRHPGISEGARISQALTGAGIASWYVAIYAAGGLYGLIPDFVTFVGLAATTATALVLALRHGAPIAALGMLGGLVTPALVGSDDPSAGLLFIYLYAVFAAVLSVARRSRLWWLSVPALLGVLGWLLVWTLGGSYEAGDSLWLGLFLIACCASIAHQTRGEEDAAADYSRLLRILGMAGALAGMALVVHQGGYGPIEWGLVALLSLGGIGLAWFDARYRPVPWAALALSAALLVLWRAAGDGELVAVLLPLTLLHAVGGLMLMRRGGEDRWQWALLHALALLGFYLLGWLRLESAIQINLFWGMAALGLAAWGAALTARWLEEYPGDQKLLAVASGMATAFLSIGLAIELPGEILSVAIAGEMLGLAWLSTRLDVAALRWLTGALLLLFGYVLLPQLILLAGLTLHGLLGWAPQWQESLPLVRFPAFQLGLPAALFLGASWLHRRRGDGRLPYALEVAAIALLALMGYYLARQLFHPGENLLYMKAGFIERGAVTNLLMLFGLLCAYLGERFARRAVLLSGLALVAAGLFRIFWFDLLTLNPIFSRSQLVGGLPLLNALWLPYGLPILWAGLSLRYFRHAGLVWAQRIILPFMLVLLFALVTLLVRQAFHGEQIATGREGVAEIYSYSAAWLLLGIALLAAAIRSGSAALRHGSLAVMLLVTAKVFLFDASGLDGLLRVLSFLGLGVSLIGLHWVYGRYLGGDKAAG